jgi:hypothetical protein
LSWPLLLLVAGYVVLGPAGSTLFLAGPLLLLLICSRPRGRGEFLWVFAAGAAFALAFRVTPSVAERPIRAAAIAFAGAVTLLTLFRVRSLSTRLIAATGIAAMATVAWCARAGIAYEAIRGSLITEMWNAYRVWWPELPPTPMDAASIAALPESSRTAMLPSLSAKVALLGNIYPAVLAIAALTGGWLAWSLYYRIAERPLGNPPRPMTEMRFNDHLVWALIAALALALFKVDPTVTAVSSNVLLVLGALYWVRGMAITRFAMALLPAPPAFKVAATALLVLPLAFGGWLLLGVADTWLDIRRRFEPPQGVSP